MKLAFSRYCHCWPNDLQNTIRINIHYGIQIRLCQSATNKHAGWPDQHNAHLIPIYMWFVWKKGSAKCSKMFTANDSFSMYLHRPMLMGLTLCGRLWETHKHAECLISSEIFHNNLPLLWLSDLYCSVCVCVFVRFFSWFVYCRRESKNYRVRAIWAKKSDPIDGPMDGFSVFVVGWEIGRSHPVAQHTF